MSIYGPPAPPARDHARRASAHATRVFLALIVIGALTYVGVMALLEFRKHGNQHLAVERAETIRLDAEARQEAMRLQTAEFLPAIPPPPPIEIPPPLQSAEPLPPGDVPTDSPQFAEPLTAPVRVERKSPPTAEPGRLQTAEILR